jgi:Na+/proline symporter
MSVQTETRAAAPKPPSSTMPPIAVALLVGAVMVAIALSISMGLTGEPQAADYLSSVPLP